MTIIEAFHIAKKHGVTAAMLHPLLLLIDDSPLTPSELAKRTQTSTANMTGMLCRMEAGGWIIRELDAEDRRKFILTPTEKAFDIFTPLLEAKP